MTATADGVASRAVKVAIIGSGNIGTDLMIKVRRLSERLDVVAMIGVDPDSDGLARARRFGLETTSSGVEGFVGLDCFDDVDLVFDATSASAHLHNDDVLRDHGKRVIDLTPAALGPFVVPSVNLTDHADARNVNMVTCGGQATIPIVASVHEMVERVAGYVPGYRLKQSVQVERITDDDPLRIPQLDRKFVGMKVSVLLEVEGAAHYLPSYAGNLDIMTSAALQTAEWLVAGTPVR